MHRQLGSLGHGRSLQLFANIQCGAFVGRYGAKSGLLLACLLQLTGSLVAAIAPHVAVLVLGRVLTGMGFAVMTISQQVSGARVTTRGVTAVALWVAPRSRALPTPQVFVSATVNTARRGRAASLYGGLIRAGGVIGPALGGVIADTWSTRGSFVLQGVWIALAALTTAVFFPANARIGVKEVSVAQTHGPHAGSGPSTTRKSCGGQTWRIMKEHKHELFTVGVFAGLLQFIREARPLVFPLAGDQFGLSKSQIGLILSLASVCDLSLFWASGLIMDKHGRKCNGMLTPILIGVGYFCLPFGSDAVAWFILAVCLIGFGNSVSAYVVHACYTRRLNSVAHACCYVRRGLVFTLGSDYAPKHERAAFIAVYRAVTDSGILIGPLATGVITDLGSVRSASWVTTGLAIAASAWMLFCVKETLHRQPPSEEGVEMKRKDSLMMQDGSASERSSGADAPLDGVEMTPLVQDQLEETGAVPAAPIVVDMGDVDSPAYVNEAPMDAGTERDGAPPEAAPAVVVAADSANAECDVGAICGRPTAGAGVAATSVDDGSENSGGNAAEPDSQV